MTFLNPKLVSKTVRTLGDGKMFTVVFTKKDGSIRTMNARLGVRRHLRGGIKTTGHIKELQTVWDCGRKEYRCFNKHAVLSIRSHGKLLAA